MLRAGFTVSRLNMRAATPEVGTAAFAMQQPGIAGPRDSGASTTRRKQQS
jgi:hypothetical protein